MKTFAHFTSDGRSQLGSDAWFRLDSRNSLETQKSDAAARIRQLRAVQPHYDGFEIHVGKSLLHTRVVFSTRL